MESAGGIFEEAGLQCEQKLLASSSKTLSFRKPAAKASSSSSSSSDGTSSGTSDEE